MLIKYLFLGCRCFFPQNERPENCPMQFSGLSETQQESNGYPVTSTRLRFPPEAGSGKSSGQRLPGILSFSMTRFLLLFDSY